jgi:hypothetical protein
VRIGSQNEPSGLSNDRPGHGDGFAGERLRLIADRFA